MSLDAREDFMMILWASIQQQGGEIRIPNAFFMRERPTQLALVTTRDMQTNELVVRAKRIGAKCQTPQPNPEVRDAASQTPATAGKDQLP